MLISELGQVGFETEEKSTREFQGRGSDHDVLRCDVYIAKNSL